jgi:hypothetical protein
MSDKTAHLPELAGRYLEALIARDPSPVARMNPHTIARHPGDGLVVGSAALTARFAAGPSWLGQDSSVEPVATTVHGRRAVAESLVHTTVNGAAVVLPVAVVVELDGHGLLAQARLYHATEPVTGSDQRREPFRQQLRDLRLDGAVGTLHDAIAAGDPKQAAAVFADPATLVDVYGGRHEGEGAVGDHFAALLNSGPLVLQRNTVTDDNARSAVEFTLVRRGADRVAARPGLIVHERAGQDQLGIVRFYETDGSQ